MPKYCEIFRCGEQTDSKGNKRLWTTKDIDEMVFNFSQNPDVPIAIGHIKGNSPAWGWVEGLKRIGESLFACYKQVQPEFEEMVNKGLFKTRSIAVDANNVLKHIAFLGAQAPAVKGLEEFTFSEEETTIFEFSDEDISHKEDTTKKGVNGSLQPTSKLVDETINSEVKCKSSHEPSTPHVIKKEDNVDETKLKEEIATKDAEIERLQKEIKRQEDEKRVSEFSAFCEEQIKAGHILPAQKEIVQNLMEACHQSAVQTFSENDEEKTPLQMFQEFVKSLPEHKLDKEIANKNNAGEDNNKDVSEFSAQDYSEKIQEIQTLYKDTKGIELDVVSAAGLIGKQ